MRRAGLGAAALAVAAGAAASMQQAPATAPAAPVSPQAAAFAAQMNPAPFNTIDQFIAQARRAQQEKPAAEPVPTIDFSPLHSLLEGLKAAK